MPRALYGHPILSSIATIIIASLALPRPVRSAESRAAPAAPQERDTARTPVVPLPPLVVTATRVPVKADLVGFAITVVTPAELAAERPLYAADALRDLPGAFIDEAVGPGGPTIVRLRGGEEVFTQILVDGVQVNQNGGFFDFQGLTLTNVERVEVARGPQSALYGSSAVSGVVQFLTPRGELSPPRLVLTAAGGDAARNGGSFRGIAEVAGGAARLRYSGGVGTAYNRGIYAQPHDTRTLDGSLRIDWSPSDRWDLTGTARFAGVESNHPVRDPGATRAPLDPNARLERDRWIPSLLLRYAPSERWMHRLRASLYREDFLFADEFDGVSQKRTYDFFIFDANLVFTSDLWRTTLEYVGSYRPRAGPGAGAFTLSYGGQWEREELSDRITGDFQDRLSLDRSSVAGFIELLAALGPRLSLVAGARAEKFEDLEVEFTPRASAVVRLLGDALSLRIAAGRAYKAPNLQQQYVDNPFIAANPDLKPETSTSWEVGADLRSRDGRLYGGLTYFRQEFDNLIRTVAQESSTQQINRNLGKSRAQGIEWSVRYQPGTRVLVGSDGSWIDMEILDNRGLSASEFPRGQPLPFRPAAVGSAFLQVTPVERVTAALRGTLVGRQWVLTERFSGRRVELDAYVLAGLNASVTVSPHLELYTRVDNLFDTAYETAFDRPGIPLTAAVGARLTN